MAQTVSAGISSRMSRLTFVPLKGRNFLIFSLPWQQATTMGTFAFCAAFRDPAWKGSSSFVLLRVPSGYIPMLQMSRFI